MAKKAKHTATQTITLNPVTNIAFDKLVLSPANVRKTYCEDGITTLAASIARRGLLQSLSVRPTQEDPTIFEIQAGGRRFRALQLLAKRKQLSPDSPIPCIIKTGGIIEDDSLAENADREDLHPADEFRAFKTLLDKGMSEDDIAAAYRVTPAVVRQRLRMASASPVIFAAFESDELTLSQLMAFCVTEDHALQDAIFKSIAAGQCNDQPWSIKNMVLENTIPVIDRRVTFVGLDAYIAAGGNVLRDLFDTQSQGHLTDPALLQTLLDAKLADLKAQYLKQGWKWVEAARTIPYEIRQRCTNLHPIHVPLSEADEARIKALQTEHDLLVDKGDLTEAEEAHADELEDLIDKLENPDPIYSPEDMARGGVFLSINYDGDLQVDAGHLKPEDNLPLDTSDTEATPEETDEETTDLKPVSEKLIQELTSYRTVAMRNAMADDFDSAFLGVLHALISGRFFNGNPACAVQLAIAPQTSPDAPELKTWSTTVALDKRKESLRKLLPETQDQLWDALLVMPREHQQALFAYCAALSVNAVKLPKIRDASRMANADALATALHLDMQACGWQTTPGNYFARLTKPQILADVAEAKNEDTANLIAHMKKQTMAIEAARLVDGTSWLPACLRTPEPTQDADTDLPAFMTGEAEADIAA